MSWLNYVIIYCDNVYERNGKIYVGLCKGAILKNASEHDKEMSK